MSTKQDSWDDYRRAIYHNQDVAAEQRRESRPAALYESDDKQQILQAAAAMWPRVAARYHEESAGHPRVLQETIAIAEKLWLELKARERGEW